VARGARRWQNFVDREFFPGLADELVLLSKIRGRENFGSLALFDMEDPGIWTWAVPWLPCKPRDLLDERGTPVSPLSRLEPYTRALLARANTAGGFIWDTFVSQLRCRFGKKMVLTSGGIRPATTRECQSEKASERNN